MQRTARLNRLISPFGTALAAALLAVTAPEALAPRAAFAGEIAASPGTDLVSLLTAAARRSGTSGRASAANAADSAFTEATLVAAIESAATPEMLVGAWSVFADEENTVLLTPALVHAMVAASVEPKARDALWSELAALARAYAKGDRRGSRDRSLLAVFERNRNAWLPLVRGLAETEGARDEVVELMHRTRVFGDDIDASIAYVTSRIPGAVARHVERERELGRAVRWEYAAFEGMIAWKNARLIPGAPSAPKTLAEMDAAGTDFITVFNCLHALDAWYRAQMLKGLGPVELFNAVVGGEKELYRLGTSGYRRFIHAIVIEGIKASGSFENFLQRARPVVTGASEPEIAWQRGLVFLRVASAYGLIDTVLETVRDRDRFIADAIDALGDTAAFEQNSSVVMDILTSKTSSPVAVAFKAALLDRLYDRFRIERAGPLRAAYGSLLSVYQTVTGDRREAGIDRDFALDPGRFDIAFDRLFSREGSDTSAPYVHRMFMRMDENGDAVETYRVFQRAMVALGARVRNEPNHDVIVFTAPGRRIEIYTNDADRTGVSKGVAEIAAVLDGKRVETVIGRGHTSIIAPLQSDAKRLLGPRVKEVAAVLVGSCGGDVWVRELIDTFGYIPYLSTKSTGRQVINNAIIKSYIRALMALQPGESLAVGRLVEAATAPYRRPGVDAELAADAGLYQVNMATVLAAQLFDTHLRRPKVERSETALRRAALGE